MDYNHPDIQAYLQNLPPVVQKCIGSAEWKVKIMEIGKKYSLQPAQIKNLEMETLLVALGIESDQEMIENIKRELDISDILAEQLTEDVNQRIYKWIYRQWSPEETKIEESAEGLSATKPESNSIHPFDVPPVNLPGEVIGDALEEEPAEKSHSLLRDQVNDFFAPPTTSSIQEPVNTPVAPSGIIRPIETPLEEPVPQKPQSFIAQKLAELTAPQKYTTDPYREPLE